MSRMDIEPERQNGKWIIIEKGRTDAFTIVENADVQPEREKAKWIRKENAVAIYYNCSSCRGALNWRGRFCPYCGAEMENRAG